jgi:site-specific DNA recombinase
MSSSAIVTEALLYCRISSEGQRDGVSLDAQIRETRAYAARQGWVIGREYVDVMSGKRDDRPSYGEMLEDIRHLTAEGKRVAVVVWRLDRLGRRLIERLRCREELKALGVPVHSAMEGGEVSDLVSSILGSVAEEEVRVLGERVRGARRQIKASGYHPIADTAFGYLRRDASPDERAGGAPRRVLDVDEPAAAFMREVFERIARGETIRSVGRWLAGLPADERGHRAWSASAVRRSLQAAVYVARHEREDGGDILEQPIGKWPALVSDDLWRKVQDELAMNRRLPKRPHTKRLLSGLARCPKCGTGMSGDSRPDKSSRRYRCDDRDGCTVTLNARSLDESALAQLGPLLDVAGAWS